MPDKPRTRRLDMSAIPYEPDQENTWDDEQDEPLELPGRPRRRFLNRWSAASLALLACGAGFYAGVRVEKGQLANSPSTARCFSSPSLGGSHRALHQRSDRQRCQRRSLRFVERIPAWRWRHPRGSIRWRRLDRHDLRASTGNTIYTTEASGNVVQVKLSSATTITKSLGVSKRSLHAGDSVVIQGAKNSDGTISATSVSDSGASDTSTGSGATSSSSGSSAANSLFGSGSGG